MTSSSSSRSSIAKPDYTVWALFGLGGLVLAFFYGYLPLFSKGNSSALKWLINSWNKETSYEHGFLVPFIMVGLVIYKRGSLREMTKAGDWRGMVVVCLGVGMFVLGVWLTQARLSVGSLSVVLWGGALYLFGTRVAWTLFVPIFLLYSAIYIPGLQQATNGLQLLATEMADEVVGLLGIQTIREGNTISSAVEGSWGFDISEGCSGIRSLMAMVLISVVYAYVVDLSFWKKVFMCSMAVPLAIVVNAVRISTILLIANFGYQDFAAGVYHDYGPFLIFPLGIMGLLLVHGMLQWPGRRRTRVARRQLSKGSPVDTK